MKITGTARTVQERLKDDAALRWTAIVAAFLLVLVFVCGVLTFVHQARASDVSKQLESTREEAETLKRDSELLKGDVAKYQPAYLQLQRTQSQKTLLDSREADIDDRQAEVEAAEKGLETREASVKAREDAATANANAGDWWVGKVRECLARSASNRVATVTEGSLIGRDTTCYTQ